MPPSFINSSPDELLQRVAGLDHKQSGGRHCGAQTVAWWSAGVGQGDESGFVRVEQVLLVFFRQHITIPGEGGVGGEEGGADEDLRPDL